MSRWRRYMDCLETTRETLGYAHPDYAASLREFGEPRELPHSGGWAIVRQIPGTPYRDAMGCYPLFCCRDWAGLREDMDLLVSELVSMTLVTDPLSVMSPRIGDDFDVVRPFKRHYVADLRRPPESFVDRGHRYNVRRVLKEMDVEVSHDPARYLDEWMRLYDNLIRKHCIRGIGAFSRSSFEAQLGLPGMVMALGRCEGEIVGATLALIQGQCAYSHLSAYSQTGYRMRASYGLFWTILGALREEGILSFDLGGVPGTKDDPDNGLAQFKRGWSNETRMTYLYGRILDSEGYEYLCRRSGGPRGDYFPAYRSS